MAKVKNNKGFTLIELLVVVSIIGLISTIAVYSLNLARLKARDAKRLADVTQIQKALDLYYDSKGVFPPYNGDSADDGCSGWDSGYKDSADVFIPGLVTENIMAKVPGDPVFSGCGAYVYYRYAAGSSGCPVSSGAFYILGIKNMESVAGAYPTSPGWACLPTRNWGSEFDWVTGRFEK